MIQRLSITVLSPPSADHLLVMFAVVEQEAPGTYDVRIVQYASDVGLFRYKTPGRVRRDVDDDSDGSNDDSDDDSDGDSSPGSGPSRGSQIGGISHRDRTQSAAFEGYCDRDNQISVTLAMKQWQANRNFPFVDAIVGGLVPQRPVTPESHSQTSVRTRDAKSLLSFAL